MTTLARIALVTVILVSAGCSSMGMGGGSTSSGDMSHNTTDSSLYGGGLY